MSSEASRITVYSDYVCPFCYLGRESLARYQESREEDLRIEWHPFDLRSRKRRPDGTIDHSVDDGKDDDYFEQARRNVRRLARQYDVEMDLDVATDVDSLPAQVVSYHLREHHDYETWLAFDEAAFEALWLDGRDVGDSDLLVDLATGVGVAADEVRSALDDDTLREDVRQQFTEARRRGAVPPERLRRLVDGV